MKRQQLISICAWSAWVLGCGGDYAKAPPPPAPPPPALPAPPAPSTPEPAAAPEPEAPAAALPSPSKTERVRGDKATGQRGAKSGAPAAPAKAAPPAKSGPSAAATSPAKPAAAAPAATVTPARPATTTAKPAGKVSVPSTAHVRVELPSALQAELDHDPRMQPWVNQVMSVIDRCYNDAARGGELAGTIEVVVTMHENDRPDADIKQLPPQLSPIVACATGGLMRTKMPLFTGAEGGRRTVRIVFK